MSSYKILIVEDQREVSRLLRTALETLEHKMEVVEIPSGEEAILYSSRNPVDLLVSDYRLPGMTGIELMVKVRKYHPEMKVILITGQTDPKVRKDVAEAGADAFFIKPVPIADFLDAVERHLGLVETILPPEPIAPLANEEPQTHLPDVLARLRLDLDAIAVFLIGDSGRILARAGDMPNSNDEISLLSSLLSIYSAGQKVTRLIGLNVSSSWHVFSGENHDLIFAPVGSAHAMLVIGKNIAAADRLLKTMGLFAAARQEVEPALSEIPTGIPASTEPPTVPTEAMEEGGGDLEPLLTRAKKKLKPADVNDFWDKAADSHKPPAKPDMLSYEQAKQLGLTPEDND
jgi:CheY-like chemotaxis protein